MDWNIFFLSTPLFIVFVLLLITIIAQLSYVVFVFAKLASYKTTHTNSALPAVSVIVAAHNELENLIELIPILNNQQYPVYEIIIVNDRSTDGTFQFSETESQQFEKVRYIHINKVYDHVTPKKYALTAAIRNAKYDVVLLTDADCRPASDQWIKLMAEKLDDNKKIVVGFSPYIKEDGFLNRLIRFETFYVALQYLSFALASKPYMGVGRNLMYYKQLFIDNKGFYSHLRVMGGDDDLLLNEIAQPHNTAICVDEDAFVYSEPKHNWTDWLNQKKRHISVSKHYKTRNKRMLGLLTMSHILVWTLFLTLMVGSTIIFGSNSYYLYAGLSIFGIYLFVKWLVLALANQKLGKTIGWFAIPFLDYILFLYYIIMGFVFWKNRNNKIRWK